MVFNSEREYILNFGPHHPSTHGVLRLVLRLQGETVVACSPDIGYLHRGVEKIVEQKKWLSIIPFLDRLDYLAPLHAEHAFALVLESTLKIKVPPRAQFIRTIYDELTRISSHIMALGCITHDVGMLSLFLYGFEEREKIMDIFEETNGARMHLNYYIPGGVFKDISEETIAKIRDFINGMGFYLEAVHVMALENRIFKNRTKKVGIISKNMAIEYGLTGANARASGVTTDLRTIGNYGVYTSVNFEIPVLYEGDCYARFKIRVEEIKQSMSIISQCLDKMPGGAFHDLYAIQCLEHKENLDNEIKESVFSYFFENGIDLPKGVRNYAAVEGARGVFGIFIATEYDTTTPYRLHIRSPSFATLQILEELLVGTELVDIPPILGSLDFLMGDCDR